MNLDYIFQELENNENSEKAKQMSRYMRDQFSFLGVDTPKRNEINKPFFKEAKKTKCIDWKFIAYCWEKPYREAQYTAIDYLKTMKEFLGLEDIQKIKSLIIKKSWWDSVDGLHRVVGDIVLKYPEADKIMIQWSLDENFWLRRIAINHQMFRKEKMKKELLEEILVNNLGEEEFFINKAIGWALRDYSKTNPKWVEVFIDKYQGRLSKLSIREAIKYI